MKKKYELIGGYPTVFATNEEKATKEYGLQYIKTMYSDWKNNTELAYQDKKRSFHKMRAYAEGTQSVAKYKDLLDVEGDSSYMNIDWTPVSTIPKFVDVVCGDMTNREFAIKANAIDDKSSIERKKAMRELMADMMTAGVRSKLTEITGRDFKKQGFVPEDMEEIELFMNLNYKQAHEISLEKGIDFVLQQNDFDEIKKKSIRDLVVVGTAALKTYIDPVEGIKIKYVDPVNLITSYSESSDYKNIQHAGEIYNITIGDLKRMAGDQFTDEEYEDIATRHANKASDNDNLFGRSFSNHGTYSSEYDKFSIEIMDCEFISTYDLNYEKKENSFGGYSVSKRKKGYKIPKKSKHKREKISSTVKVVYSGKYVVGTDYIFDYGLAKNMSRPKSNLSETRLSYIVYSPNLNRMSNVSLVQRMIPFADQIQLAHLKMQQVMAKARPKGAAFEIGSLENVSKGDGGTFTPLELQEIYDQTGNIYYRRVDDEGVASNTVPIQELENGIGRDMMQLIQIYQHNLNMIRDVTGVNEARDGAKPSSEALVGVQKIQLMASNNATRSIDDGFTKIVENLAKSLSMKLQDVVEYDKPLKGYMSAVGSASMKTIKINKNISLHDFGIGIEVAPDEEEKARLEQSIQMSLAQKELRLEDAINIRDINNPKLGARMLILRRKKYQEEQIKIAQGQSQANSQQQQQSAAMAAQMKQGEMQMQAQMDAKMKEMDSQFEMQKIQMEYQLKNQFEEQAHIRRLKEIDAGNMGKVAANQVQGESREKSAAKSAHYQSKMIEQRKGKDEPIGDPDMMIEM
tara:strand:+ start:1197 stop:3593 length:2397 start_codon:yes stop_codon:yes gene_type:complete